MLRRFGENRLMGSGKPEMVSCIIYQPQILIEIDMFYDLGPCRNKEPSKSLIMTGKEDSNGASPLTSRLIFDPAKLSPEANWSCSIQAFVHPLKDFVLRRAG